MNNYYQPGNGTQHYWQQPQQEMSLDARVSQVMKNVYVKMFLALLVTAAVSVGVALFKTDLALYIHGNRMVYWGLAILELVLVLVISARLNKLAPAMATGLFYLFAVVNGLTLSILCLAFSFASLFKTFLICAGTFGAMSVYGYFTTRDLTKIGSFLYMALFGLLIMIVVNIFWANSTLDWIISGAVCSSSSASPHGIPRKSSSSQPPTPASPRRTSPHGAPSPSTSTSSTSSSTSSASSAAAADPPE